MIVKILRNSEDKVATSTGKRTIRVRKQVTRLVAALIICFVVSWLPLRVFDLLRIKGVFQNLVLFLVFTQLKFTGVEFQPLFDAKIATVQ